MAIYRFKLNNKPSEASVSEECTKSVMDSDIYDCKPRYRYNWKRGSWDQLYRFNIKPLNHQAEVTRLALSTKYYSD